LVSCLEAVQ